MTDASREAIAAVQHEIWSHWMEYMFRVCKQNDDGSMTIPADKVTKWTRQQPLSTHNNRLSHQQDTQP